MNPSTRFLVLGNPRSGTTYLMTLLHCHGRVDLAGEPLNDEETISGNPFQYVDQVLVNSEKPVVGFKCFPEQLEERGLRIDDLVRHLKSTTVVVAWRQNVLEMYVSRKIAYKTGVWYSETAPPRVESVRVDEDELRQFAADIEAEWRRVGAQWPIEVSPLFVNYEDLLSDPSGVAGSILTKLGLGAKRVVFKTWMQRQNPANIRDKVLNYDELSREVKTLSVNVPEILSEAILAHIPIPDEVKHLLPAREPPPPPRGWLYRVAEPYMPAEARRNVFDAVDGRCVSSAGYWPKKLSNQLQQIYGLQTAQPCANGFSALVLALQAAGVGAGDEVIVPTLTMIAVPNSVCFVGAKPVWVDCASPLGYNPGIENILAAATEKTKAVIVSHTYGVPVDDMEALADLCRSRNWTLIEDIAEAIGIRDSKTGRLLGTFGDFACASLYANKIVHAGDGGFVLAKDPKYDSRLFSLVNHGFTRSFHFLHYETAINAKINGMGAALASGVFDRLGDVMKNRSLIAQWYKSRLADTPLTTMPRCGLDDTPWVFGCLCRTKSERTDLRRHLAERGVETRDFFLPMHLQPAFQNLNQTFPRFAEAERLGATGFYFPTFTDLKESDVEFICDVVKHFYDMGPEPTAPRRETIREVRVKPDTFSLEVPHPPGVDNRSDQQNHLDRALIDAVSLTYRFDRHLHTDRWDEGRLLVDEIEECIEESKAVGVDHRLRRHFDPILKYLRSQSDFEPTSRREWISENVVDGPFAAAQFIPTTTEVETLQMLVWLTKKLGAESILEIGPWLGRSSANMAIAAMSRKNPKVVAVDGFRWQSWMNPFAPGVNFAFNECFLDVFRANMQKLGLADIVHPVEWSAGDRLDLGDQKFDLIVVDFTQDAQELEQVWPMIEKNCVSGKTVVVFNGVVASAIDFFANHRRELKSLYKPHTVAKAFIYESPLVEKSDSAFSPQIETSLPRKFKFLDSPRWQHHHNNAFAAAIEKLKSIYHDDRAPVAFLPAVEDYFCDFVDRGLDRPWVGVVHHLPEYPTLFYYPDLKRLCQHANFEPHMRSCLGLFTLTKLQADYLREHLPKDIRIPICSLTYPSFAPKSIDIDRSIFTQNIDRLPLAFIGSFARDIDYFYKIRIPSEFKKVLVAGDEKTTSWAKSAPDDVEILDRLDENRYENLLSNCVAFLSLTHDGAANTLIVECIARCTPILAPRLKSCVEYLGDDYPLFYDPARIDLTNILSSENLSNAVNYLRNMDKAKFSLDYFCRRVETSAVMKMSTPFCADIDAGSKIADRSPTFDRYNLTVLICSYKRTHHLAEILNRLWNEQSNFDGRLEIIVWNNNNSRRDYVHRICAPYLNRPSNGNRKLELIDSSENHYCAVRMCMPTLMSSDRLLICDDDVVPNRNFARFFYDNSLTYPDDVLCVRGHRFLPHRLRASDPDRVWKEYENLRFVDDHQPSQLIHFVHADACLLPKSALREWSSVEMPDPAYSLIDDYWMSYVLNHRFGRNLRKLSTASVDQAPFRRTDDSDQKDLALHTRAEVRDARSRFYIYHMLSGWPNFDAEAADFEKIDTAKLEELKTKKWALWKNDDEKDKKAFFGFNVSSKLNEKDADDLVRLGVRHVRIGAVGSKKETHYELSDFQNRPQRQLEDLLETIDMLAKRNITVVITLSYRLATGRIWSLIADKCVGRWNVIGYDLINEPYSERDSNNHWMDIDDNDRKGEDELTKIYKSMIDEIRKVDPITPLILEPLFWAHVDALPSLENLFRDLDADVKNRIVVSFHFYEPMRYTTRRLNGGAYTFPGTIPVYANEFSERLLVDENWIKSKFEKAIQWSKKVRVPIFLGETGVARDMPGAADYLRSIFDQCKSQRLAYYVYAFRDPDWEAMDYEFGSKMGQFPEKNAESQKANELMAVIRKAILCED